ncbi:hypothetical protein DFH07DRAFT_971107 [Mycena maculata]|uniref:Uncharacterized protein n=1 Tax=Mycena maculata TaxID=230809 RepID=A0AAD7HNF5_9AGAR|nr:hypothetical protein DFH07DRAFT_971107 [Mycena maculata]
MVVRRAYLQGFIDGKVKVELYFGNISPVGGDFDDLLTWWKNMQGTLPFMVCVA